MYEWPIMTSRWQVRRSTVAPACRVVNHSDSAGRLLASLIQRLQSVQNAAARLIYSIRRSEHITDALISLHWLHVQERIVFKVAVLTYRAVHGTAPPYLSSEFTRVADVTGSRIERKRKIGKRKKGKRKKGKWKNGKPKCSRKKGKRKIGKLQACLFNVKCTAPRQRVSVRNREVGYFCYQSSSYQIAYAVNNEGVSTGPTQGPYILQLCNLHGSIILLRGLTHPDLPLISHTGRRGHHVSRCTLASPRRSSTKC